MKAPVCVKISPVDAVTMKLALRWTFDGHNTMSKQNLEIANESNRRRKINKGKGHTFRTKVP